CNRAPIVVVVPPAPPANPAAGANPAANTAGAPQIALPELTPQERYDAALWDALALVADHKLPEALAGLEKARALQDTEHVRREIAKLKVRLDAKVSAERTALDIQTVLTDGQVALAALRDAAAAWDTLQVRQEIDDCLLALQSRRERLGVADFETRGEVGLPQFGRTVAEELLPVFKTRFDLIERDQLGKVLDELK